MDLRFLFVGLSPGQLNYTGLKCLEIKQSELEFLLISDFIFEFALFYKLDLV